MTLLARSLRRVAVLFVSIASILAAFQITIIAVARSLDEGGNLQRLAALTPSYMRIGFGPALTSFTGMTTIGYFEPLIVMIVVQFVVYLATEPAGEVESGLVDLVLARPWARHRLISRSLVVTTAAAVALPLAMGLGTVLGLWFLAPPGAKWPDARIVRNLMLHLTAIAWCFGAAALAAAAWARRRGSAHALMAMTAVVLYLVQVITGLWPPAHRFSRFFPF